MNIKLVTNIEDGIYSPINRQVMLQTVDDSYQLENYSGKKLYILNTATNERFEILPTLKKYKLDKPDGESIAKLRIGCICLNRRQG